MESSNYFNRWILSYRPLVFILLLFVLFTAMAQFASFALIQHYVISSFGAQPEDISLAFQMTYIGILATLPLQFRFSKWFYTRNYLLVALGTGILFNLGCLYVQSIYIFMVLRFLIGITTSIVAGCLLIVILSALPEKSRMVVGVSSFFGLLLSVGIIVGIAATWVVERMDWTSLYYFLMALQIFSIIFCFLVFKGKSLHRRVPLYQIDYLGAILFVAFSFSLAYTFIYGPKYYWFEDISIQFSGFCAIFSLIFFLIHQNGLKRPSIDIKVFKYKKFWFGLLLLMVFFGIKDTINLVYGYAAGILGWSPTEIVSLGLFNVLGVIISTYIAAKVVLAKKHHLPKLLLTGFSLLLFYHFWIYTHLTPDLSYTNLVFPVFTQGFASGLLFAPIIMLCMASVPTSTGMTGIVVCACGRFIASLNSVAGFYTLQENYKQQFKMGLLENVTFNFKESILRNDMYRNYISLSSLNKETAYEVADALLQKNIAIQIQLLTNRAIFQVSIYIVAIAILALITFAVVNSYFSKKKAAARS
ncbi:MAG: MFS transporter [Sediminicola sp.]